MFKSLKGAFAALAVGGIGLVVVSNICLADDYQHAVVKSTNGTVIQLDYTQGIFRDGYIVASPLWIHVDNSTLQPGDRVRVVLTVYDEGRQEQFEQVDLHYSSPGRFEGFLRGGLMLGWQGNEFQQQLACVVSGKWLTDPINRTSSFQLTLWKK